MNNFFQKPVLAALPLVAAFMARPNEVNAQDCNAVRTALTPSNNAPSNLQAASQSLIALTHLDTLVPSTGPFPLNIPDELRPAQRCLDSLLTASDTGAAIAAGIGTNIRTLGNIREYFVGTTEIDLDRANDEFAEINRRQDGGAIASGQEVVDLAKNYRDTLQAIKIILDPNWTPPAETNSDVTAAAPTVAAPAATAETQPPPQFTGEEMDRIVQLVNRILRTLDVMHANNTLPANNQDLARRLNEIIRNFGEINSTLSNLAPLLRKNGPNPSKLESALNKIESLSGDLQTAKYVIIGSLVVAILSLISAVGSFFLLRRKIVSGNNEIKNEILTFKAQLIKDDGTGLLQTLEQAISNIPNSPTTNDIKDALKEALEAADDDFEELENKLSIAGGERDAAVRAKNAAEAETRLADTKRSNAESAKATAEGDLNAANLAKDAAHQALQSLKALLLSTAKGIDPTIPDTADEADILAVLARAATAGSAGAGGGRPGGSPSTVHGHSGASKTPQEQLLDIINAVVADKFTDGTQIPLDLTIRSGFIRLMIDHAFSVDAIKDTIKITRDASGNLTLDDQETVITSIADSFASTTTNPAHRSYASAIAALALAST